MPAGVTAPRERAPFRRCAARFSAVIFRLRVKDIETSPGRWLVDRGSWRVASSGLGISTQEVGASVPLPDAGHLAPHTCRPLRHFAPTQFSLHFSRNVTALGSIYFRQFPAGRKSGIGFCFQFPTGRKFAGGGWPISREKTFPSPAGSLCGNAASRSTRSFGVRQLAAAFPKR